MQTRNLNVPFNGGVLAGFNFEDLPIEAARLAAVMQIDQAADLARASVVSDPLRAFEHQKAAIEARAFAAESYAGEVPPYVQVWADAAELEPRAAADSIIAQAKSWDQVLLALRAARLKGKQDIQKAVAHGVVEATCDEAIDAINSVTAQLSL
ncbi:hypothetical protein ACQKIS_00905 [Pseudomonas fulva]|uniref:hypothetical protein n=1 Tax=Pseudomonas fulva TaxID=47880 RepID=UPI003D005E64